MSSYKREEMEKIITEYGDMVYRMAYIQVKNRDIADDIYQEVWMKLIRQKTYIEPGEHLKAWLLRMTINCCKDYWKSAWVQKIVGSLETENEVGMAVPQETEDERDVTECVQRLPQKYRAVIHLYYYEDYSQKEIASMLGMKENTVASLLKRGRERLKKMLEKGETV